MSVMMMIRDKIRVTMRVTMRVRDTIRVTMRVTIRVRDRVWFIYQVQVRGLGWYTKLPVSPKNSQKQVVECLVIKFGLNAEYQVVVYK